MVMFIQGDSRQNNSSPISSREAYNWLLKTSAEMSYLDSMVNLSEWDQAISMPPNATRYRAKAQSYLVDLVNKKWIDPEFGRMLSLANNGSNWSEIEAANIRLWNRNYNKRIKLPPDFAARESEMASMAQAAWEEARKKNNYSLFQPHLKDMIELNKEKARCWGYEDNLYDALLDDFAPGMTVAKYNKLFDLRIIYRQRLFLKNVMLCPRDHLLFQGSQKSRLVNPCRKNIDQDCSRFHFRLAEAHLSYARSRV